MPHREFLSRELRKNILLLLDAGHGYRSIARYFSLSRETTKTIRDIWRRGDLGYFGEDTKLTKHYYPNEFKVAMVKNYLASGKPLKTFCRENQISHATLRCWLKRYEQNLLL